MSYVNYFPTFHQLEPTLLPEESGFVVSQVEVDSSITKKAVGTTNFIENGILCSFTAAGKIGNYTADSTVLMIHWDEELNTILPGNKYFAVEVEEVGDTYIRCIRLVPGCEWTTTIPVSNTQYAAAITAGKIVKVADTTMPDGTTAYAYRCIA